YNICKSPIVSVGEVKENKGYPPREGRGQAMYGSQLGSKVRVFNSGLLENCVPPFSTNVKFESQHSRDDLRHHPQVMH
ncbi:MAG: hypothetical protein M1368_01480, partial [Thaumarchaeota archaeon]|nr:hypothetical protein [Nitrososphaerota archaeon]